MIRRGFIALALVLTGSFGLAFGASDTALAAPSACDDKGMLLTLKPWYYGLSNDDCSIKSPDDASVGGIQNFVIRIALTIVEDLLNVVAFVAIGFILYGGFIYLTSSGSPERATTGRKTITNAAIGIVIAAASIALVNLIGGGLGI